MYVLLLITFVIAFQRLTKTARHQVDDDGVTKLM